MSAYRVIGPLFALVAASCVGSPTANPPGDARVLDTAPPVDGRAIDAPAAPTCHIADATWLPERNQYLVFTTTGRVLFLDDAGRIITDKAFADYSGMAKVCAGTAGNCRIDGVSFRPLGAPADGHGLVQIVANSRLWNLEQTLIHTGDSPLSSISGMQLGPCAGLVECHIDSFLWREDLQQYFVVGKGQLYTLGANGEAVSSIAMRSNASLAAGPCAGQTGDCHLDAVMHRPPLVQVVYQTMLYNFNATTLVSDGPAGRLSDLPGLASYCR